MINSNIINDISYVINKSSFYNNELYIILNKYNRLKYNISELNLLYKQKNFFKEKINSLFISIIPQLLGNNPIIWNLNQEYNDSGLNLNINLVNNLNITTNININNVGSYYYSYNFFINTNQYVLTRTIYIIDYSVLENIPIIDIGEDNSNNIANILIELENSNYFKNDELLLSNNFYINFQNINKTYYIPIELFNNIYQNNNNIIIIIYGFNNEIININNNHNNDNNIYLPYISNTLVVQNLVNVILNTNNNYKLIILDGKNTDLLEGIKPTIELLGSNPYYLELYSEFIEPGYNVTDYSGNNIELDISYNNINNTILGEYYKLYIVQDSLELQASKIRKINVIQNS